MIFSGISAYETKCPWLYILATGATDTPLSNNTYLKIHFNNKIQYVDKNVFH